jgi:hypothetical protein
MIEKDDVRAVIAQIRDRYATYGEVGMTTENGKPLRPATSGCGCTPRTTTAI